MIHEKTIPILFCLWNNPKLPVTFIRRAMMIERNMYFILFKKSLHITTVSITRVMTLQRKNKLKIHVYEVKFREKKPQRIWLIVVKKIFSKSWHQLQ